MLAKVAELKARLGIEGSAQDTNLSNVLRGASALLDRHCGRVFEYSATARVKVYDGDEFDLRLDCWPIVGDPVVKLALDRDFAAATALTAGTDYLIDRARGLIRYPYQGVRWPVGLAIIQVSWTGGYVDPATTPLPPGTEYVPGHIQEACLLEAADLWRRKDEPGYKVVWQSGEVSGGYAAALEIIPLVRALLANERR